MYAILTQCSTYVHSYHASNMSTNDSKIAITVMKYIVTRPIEQCKSLIDVLNLRKYLEKENIFFCGGEGREGKYLER